MTRPASHDHVQVLLGLYVLGALSGDERPLVARHLARCADCRAVGAEFARVRAALDRLAPEELAAIMDEFPPDP
jgi:anti-sigma factor RsiW